MIKYVITENNTETKHQEKHNSLLQMLTATLMQSDYSQVELFSATEDPATESYYKVHRNDAPLKFINVVFVP
jgi:hypothetical protein